MALVEEKLLILGPRSAPLLDIVLTYDDLVFIDIDDGFGLLSRFYLIRRISVTSTRASGELKLTIFDGIIDRGSIEITGAGNDKIDYRVIDAFMSDNLRFALNAVQEREIEGR